MIDLAFATTHLSISAVERDTGLSKDVLRVWERRYGFPLPERDASGERLYPLPQVERLRAIKRLIDAGHRPGKLLLLDERALAALSARHSAQTIDDVNVLQRRVFALLRSHDAGALDASLSRLLLKQGISAFVNDSVVPLTRAAAEAAVRGDLQMFHERMFVQCVGQILRRAIGLVVANGAQPSVLIASFPNEGDALALLMARAILAPEEVSCVPLGSEVPVPDIAAAAHAYQSDAVLVLFSNAHSTKNAMNGLQMLRGLLTPNVDLWVGGDVARRLRPTASGVFVAPSLSDIPALARQWCSSHL